MRQVLFVHRRQAADDAKVEQDIAAKSGRFQADLDVAGVHVGMKKPIAEDLGEKDRHPVAGQFFDVHARIAQLLHLADGDALHALHHQNFWAAKIPVHLRNQHQVKTFHIAFELGGTGSLADQIQLIMQMPIKLGHDFTGLQPFAIVAELFNPARHHVHQAQVFFNHGQHIGAQHLDGDFTHATLTVGDGGEMHLRDRGTGHGCDVKTGKNLCQRFAKSLFNIGDGDGRIKWRYSVLQACQLVCDVQRHQIPPCGQHLAKLDKNGTQTLQSLPQTLTARCR